MNDSSGTEFSLDVKVSPLCGKDCELSAQCGQSVPGGAARPKDRQLANQCPVLLRESRRRRLRDTLLSADTYIAVFFVSKKDDALNLNALY